MIMARALTLVNPSLFARSNRTGRNSAITDKFVFFGCERRCSGQRERKQQLIGQMLARGNQIRAGTKRSDSSEQIS